ncbi:hypothetical protein AN7838.2 [Aspergillus nidulans FGSC A4]|uniref:PKS-like enzyme, putative (JCVI) n=1 Tax=Emericella nidulans (strain FGSC A4 / ATCC 38163 / CBS 112.46 / NRRL 194 / M139) TaxID=227321 RepID=Q5AV42_EMENI|nr:hypothetical protein [Aspergillus nidulans FGSC A4]EAA61177.1 hypothetical protein AN7838.2 [Aspergillus nidulans FGSC A4]CBF80211.1 TPA: PKS-like enzyme, putative (JCVI) [Aspergillus nidulans FGSC A4]|eukprot:XP_681107.1 hypothetical protein AN7838.2 [Aspergillus nidulans FGSC A4]
MDMQALITGTNLILHPNFMAQYSAMGMIGPDGISRSFDASANGYGRGEGIACVVIKRLADAMRDRDCIRAVIRGTAANHDGRTPSITKPSQDAHAFLIRETYQKAGLPLSETAYFEAHGTGTPQGDPIEMRAIAQTVASARRDSDVGPLYVGSVKPNVGHTEGAAGLAGVIKVVLCLEAGTIPAVTGLTTVNPELRLTEWNIALPQENMAWPQDRVRRASVNSFGFGGANAHAILEDAKSFLQMHHMPGLDITDPRQSLADIRSEDADGNERLRLLVLSAHDRAGIRRVADSYASYFMRNSLSHKSESTVTDSLCHILATRRSHFDFRSYVVAGTETEWLEQLGKPQDLTVQRVSAQNKVAFVFTGQGAQRPGMGKELLCHSAFRASLWRSQKVLDMCGVDWEIINMLLRADAETLARPEHAQPVCTALQIALVDLLSDWGIQPGAVVGHSSGEIGAAYAAGIISADEAMYIAFHRGYLSAAVASRNGVEGSMLAAGLSESEANRHLANIDCADEVTIACINSPRSVTFSGSKPSIAALHDVLSRDGKFSRILRTGVAYHSAYMAVIAPDLDHALTRLPERTLSATVPMYSSVTEEAVGSSGLSRGYWVKNMLQPVRFAGALQTLLSSGTQYSAILEIGPTKTLQGPIQQILSSIGPNIPTQPPYRSMLVAGQHAGRAALEAAGFLWATGHAVDLDRVNGISTQDITLATLPHLPSYPWNHEHRFWHDTSSSRPVRLRSQPRTDLLGVPVNGQNKFEPRWRNLLSIAENPWLADHTITGVCLYPAAGYLVMALEAVVSQAPTPAAIRAVEFTNVTFETGLALQDSGPAVDISLTLLPHTVMDGVYSFSIYSESPDSTRRLAYGSVATVCHVGNLLDPVEMAAQEQEWEAAQSVLREARENTTVHIDHRTFYKSLAALGLNYGPTFRGLDRITVSREYRTACSSLKIPDTKSVMPEQFEYPHLLHPATLDCAFQLSFAALQAQDDLRQPFVPASVGRIFISTDLPSGAGSSFIGTSSARHVDGSVVADSLFTDADASAPKIVIDSLAMTNVGDGSSETAEIPARTANLVWKEDVSSVIGSHVGNSLEWVDTWLDSFRHKYADANVLFVAAAEHLTCVESSNMAGQITLLEPCEDGQLIEFSHSQRRALPQHVVQQKLSASASYDAVVVDARLSDQISWLSASLSSIMKPCGHLVMFGRGGCDDLAGDTWLEELIKNKGFSILQMPNSQLQVALAAPGQESTLQVPFTTETDSITILERDTTDQTLHLRQTIVQLLSAAGIHNVRVVHWDDPIASFHNQCVVSLVENSCPFFYDVDDKGLTHFRNLIASRPRYLLWTTTGNLLAPDEAGIQYAPTTGFLRTARSEYPLVPLQHLDLSHEASQMPGTAAGIIVNVLLAALQGTVQAMETEVAESGGRLYIPRLVANKAMDIEIGRDVKPSACLPVPLSNLRHPTRLQVSPDGSVHWVAVDPNHMEGDLTANEVLINTRYTTISTTFPGQSKERPLFSSLMAVDTVGIVEKIGHGVTELCPGDTVLVQSANIQNRFCEDAPNVVKVPTDLSPVQVAYWINPLACAYYLLTEIGNIWSSPLAQYKSVSSMRLYGQYTPPRSPPLGVHQRLQSILIDVEGPALRHALVQMAQWLLLDIFVVIPPGDPQREAAWATKCTVLAEVTRAISGMIRRSNPRSGVDMVLSSLQNLSCVPHMLSSLTHNGHLVAVDMNPEADVALGHVMPRGFTNFASLYTTHIDPSNVRYSQRAALRLLANGTIVLPELPTNPPAWQQPVSRVDKIFQRSSSSASASGRIVFSFEPSHCLSLRFSVPAPIQLAPAGTYILSGGLGVLGQQIAHWLCNDHGARHLVFLSRSGALTPGPRETLRVLSQQGCRCDVVRCDITSTEAVQTLASTATMKNWSIKGIIQAAMVLADSPMVTMDSAKWEAAAAPKIRGSWNLHKFLGNENLDFFVLLSSVSGIIGNSAQANYSAGNTFEDALAAYRCRLGLPAVSLNLGLVTDTVSPDSTSPQSGVDATELLAKFPHLSPVMVSKSEVRSALRAALRGRSLNNAPLPHQVVVGISDEIRLEDGGSTNLSTSWQSDPKFNHRICRRPGAATTTTTCQTRVNYAQAIRAANNTEAARLVVEQALRLNIANAIASEIENITVEKPVTAYGVDSLRATELRNWASKHFDSQVSIFDILRPEPISSLASVILSKSPFRGSGVGTPEKEVGNSGD